MGDRRQIDDVTVCTDCGSVHLITDSQHAELVCEDCGLVMQSNIIDQGAEWRTFDSNQIENKARTGPAMTGLLHDKGLTTDVGYHNIDYTGKSLPPKNRALAWRIRKNQRRSRIANAMERNVAQALFEIERISSQIGLPKNIRETAARNYRKAMEKRLIRGRSIEGVAAASIYAACRQCNIPRTLDEVTKVSRVGKKDLGRTYRLMARKLKLHILPTSPNDYISRFCSQLNLEPRVEVKTAEILVKAHEKDIISGRGPTGMAAASIYIASLLCDTRRTQKDISQITGVTEVTIRNRYKEICRNLGISLETR